MRIIFHKRVPVFILGFIIGFGITTLFVLLQHLFKVHNLCNTKKSPKAWNIKHILQPFKIMENSNNLKDRINIKYSNNIKETGKFNFCFNMSKMEAYNKWLKSLNVYKHKLNMDYYLHAPKYTSSENKVQRLESDWLKNKVHLTCIIFVEKIKLAESIWNTWASHCNTLYFFSRKNKDLPSIVPVINLKIRFISSWQYLCQVLNYIWQKSQTLEWLIFVKDDTVVIPENLRFLVAPLDFNKTYYLGHPIVLWGQVYNVAQAGYVLSKASVEKLVEKFNSSDKCATSGKYWKMEDYYLGKHLTSLDIHPSDTRDSNLRGIFHGYSLITLIWGVVRPSNYWTKALYPLGPDCCSAFSVTFSAAEADKFYTLNYILYYLHVHKNLGIYGNRPAPTPIPEEEVWKSVLREEFGINNITKMSSEKYYDIWRSRCSEPEEFIAQKFKAMSDI